MLTRDLATSVSFLSAAFSSSSVSAEHGRAIVATELLRPGDQRAVAGYLVVFDGLGGGDDRGVEHLLVLDFADNLVRLPR